MALASQQNPFEFSPNETGAQAFLEGYRKAASLAQETETASPEEKSGDVAKPSEAQIAFLKATFDAMWSTDDPPKRERIYKYKERELRDFAIQVAKLASPAEFQAISEQLFSFNIEYFNAQKAPAEMFRNAYDLARHFLNVFANTCNLKIEAEAVRDLPTPKERILYLQKFLQTQEIPPVIQNLFSVKGPLIIKELLSYDLELAAQVQQAENPAMVLNAAIEKLDIANNEDLQIALGRSFIWNILNAPQIVRLQTEAGFQKVFSSYKDVISAIAGGLIKQQSGSTETNIVFQAMVADGEIDDRTLLRDLGCRLLGGDSKLNALRDDARKQVAQALQGFPVPRDDHAHPEIRHLVMAQYFLALQDVAIANARKIFSGLGVKGTPEEIQASAVASVGSFIRATENAGRFTPEQLSILKSLALDNTAPKVVKPADLSSPPEWIKFQERINQRAVIDMLRSAGTIGDGDKPALTEFYNHILKALNGVKAPQNFFNDEQVIDYFGRLRVAAQEACYDHGADGKRIGLSPAHKGIYAVMPQANVAKLIQHTMDAFFRTALEHVDRVQLVEPLVRHRDAPDAEAKSSPVPVDRDAAQINALAAKRKEQLLRAGATLAGDHTKFKRPVDRIFGGWSDTLPKPRAIDLGKITGVFASEKAYTFPEAMALAQTSLDLAMIKEKTDALVANYNVKQQDIPMMITLLNRVLTSSATPQGQFQGLLDVLTDNSDLDGLIKLIRQPEQIFNGAFVELEAKHSALKNTGVSGAVTVIANDELDVYKLIIDLHRHQRPGPQGRERPPAEMIASAAPPLAAPRTNTMTEAEWDAFQRSAELRLLDLNTRSRDRWASVAAAAGERKPEPGPLDSEEAQAALRERNVARRAAEQQAVSPLTMSRSAMYGNADKAPHFPNALQHDTGRPQATGTAGAGPEDAGDGPETPTMGDGPQ